MHPNPEPNTTELLIADSRRLDEKMTAKYGTPFWHEATMLEAWRETMQTKTFPLNNDHKHTRQTRRRNA